MASGRLTSWQIDGETVERVTDFMFWSSQITTNGDCSHEIKMLAPWKKSYDQPHASKVMLIILQARLQQYMNCELLDVQASFRKGRGPEIKLQHLLHHGKSKRVPEKHLFLLS